MRRLPCGSKAAAGTAGPRRCRSSVVEHSLGKGEVRSSILRGSTSKSRHLAAISSVDASASNQIAICSIRWIGSRVSSLSSSARGSGQRHARLLM